MNAGPPSALAPEAAHPSAQGRGKPACEIGVVGLGVMGRNFLLNVSGHGYPVAGYDKDPAKVDDLRREAGGGSARGASDIGEFVSLLRAPRAIVLLVPAGPVVDAVIGDLLGHLTLGDVIVDAGNSYFGDTDRRAGDLASKGISFLGVGVSGGEEGARNGPSIMPGGPRQAYERVRPVLEAAAAQFNGEPCVTYLGPGSAGHFVKMVHNGIEYGLMQLIAETYDLMKRGAGLTDEELHEFFAGWNHGEMEGYLMEITGRIFSKGDGKHGRLIDDVRGVAAQLGTGTWASQSAMDLQVPVPTIDAAVAMRNLSALEGERASASSILRLPASPFRGDGRVLAQQLGRALFAGTIIAYAQGFALLKAGSERHAYGLDLAAVARIWRGGCIIRTALLENIWEAFCNQPALLNLLLDMGMAKRLLAHQGDLRASIAAAVQLGIPAPGLMTALAYMDAYRSSWQPANLIQAQRDYFGAHGFERIDAKGAFHVEWGKA